MIHNHRVQHGAYMGASRHWPRPAAELTGHTEPPGEVKKNGLVDQSSGLGSIPDTEIKEVKRVQIYFAACKVQISKI